MPDGSVGGQAPESVGIFPVLPEQDRGKQRQELGAFMKAKAESTENINKGKEEGSTAENDLSGFLAGWLMENIGRQEILSGQGMKFSDGLTLIVRHLSGGLGTEHADYLTQIRKRFIEESLKLGEFGREMRWRWDGAMVELATSRLIHRVHGVLNEATGSHEKPFIKSEQEWDAGKVDLVWFKPLGEGVYQPVCFQLKSRNGVGECIVDMTDPNFRNNLDFGEIGGVFDDTDMKDNDIAIMRETAKGIQGWAQKKFPKAQFVDPQLIYLRTDCGPNGMVSETNGNFRGNIWTDSEKAQARYKRFENRLVDVTINTPKYEQRAV